MTSKSIYQDCMTSNQIIDGHDISNLFDLNKQPISFADDLTKYIPKYGSIIYTVWDSKQNFVYVGIGGVGSTKNPRSRIAQHRNGGRSGDQFCVYIQDFFILPELLKKEHYKPEKGLLDHQTKTYIQRNLGYRFVIIEKIARKDLIAIEEQIKRGVFGFPAPLLNGFPDVW